MNLYGLEFDKRKDQRKLTSGATKVSPTIGVSDIIGCFYSSIRDNDNKVNRSFTKKYSCLSFSLSLVSHVSVPLLPSL